MDTRLALCFVCGAILRFILLVYNEKFHWILDSVAVSTPMNSWKRVNEGIFLYRKGISPYSGGVFHETPLVLLIFEYVTRNWQWVLPAVFVSCDLLTALFLSKVGRYIGDYTLGQDRKIKPFPGTEKLLLDPNDVERFPFYVAVGYLFHPYSLLSCGGMTTTVFSNLLLASTLHSMFIGNGVLMAMLIGAATYQSFYPLMFILPCSLFVAQKTKHSNKEIAVHVIFLTTVFGIILTLLLYTSFWFLKSWNFLEALYGCMLRVDDLTPNIGLFWYFFTEMFDHFRQFFIYTFQINAFIYVLPLVFRFKNDLVIVVFTLLGLMCIFKSYPSIGDIALYTSLLSVWTHLYQFMRQTFVILCFFLACSVLGPVMFDLWIYYGNANANFFFGTTLAFNAAQIFLITDILFAYIKREYHLINGLKPQIDGELGKLALK